MEPEKVLNNSQLSEVRELMGKSNGGFAELDKFIEQVVGPVDYKKLEIAMNQYLGVNDLPGEELPEDLE